jgi:hypothetical protein
MSKMKEIKLLIFIVTLVFAFPNIYSVARGPADDGLNPGDFEKRKNSVIDGAILQTQGIVSEVSDLLVKKDFDRLEKIVSSIREGKLRSKGGNWQLNYYYENLSLRWTGFTPSREEWLYGIFDEWMEKNPDSVTPRIAKAKAYIDFAWEARGRGYASTVTETGWKKCNEKLDKARSLLVEAERIYPKDPEIYALQLEIGRITGKSREEMESIFQKGIKVERAYYPLYHEMATTLMQRWGGKKGELEAFMDRAVELTKETEGESFYPRISDMIFRYYRFKDFQREFNIPYERLRKGYWDLLDRYPETRYYSNSFCYMACLNKDKDTARKLFARIGRDYDPSAWRGKDSFESCRTWALEE